MNPQTEVELKFIVPQASRTGLVREVARAKASLRLAHGTHGRTPRGEVGVGYVGWGRTPWKVTGNDYDSAPNRRRAASWSRCVLAESEPPSQRRDAGGKQHLPRSHGP